MKDFVSFNAVIVIPLIFIDNWCYKPAFIGDYLISHLSDKYKLVHNDLFSWSRGRLSEKLETLEDWFLQ